MNRIAARTLRLVKLLGKSTKSCKPKYISLFKFNRTNTFCTNTKEEGKEMVIDEEGETDESDQSDDNFSMSYTSSLLNLTLVDENVKGTSIGGGGLYYLLFTCKVCEGKFARKFTKNAYHEGVVLIKCEGCGSLHLIADNLNWFSDKKENIESLAKDGGEKSITVDDEKIKQILDEFHSKTMPNINEEDGEQEFDPEKMKQKENFESPSKNDKDEGLKSRNPKNHEK